MANDSALIFTSKDHVAFLTLNRRKVKNVINAEMARQIVEACAQVARDRDIYAVVITGAGKTFCAAGEWDIGDASPVTAVAELGCPVIAAINGDAAAEGLELALACDIRIAAVTARFALPQPVKGRLPQNGGTQRLARLVGKSQALELLLTGRIIAADEALAMGLVNRVVPAPKLMGEAETLAEEIAGKAPLAVRYIKEAVRDGIDLPLAQGLRLEADLYFLLHTTSDRTEGIRAFLEKRPPHFQGK
ncbi:MAG: enoyl-CoA hydratase-related protein [Dehalococcoidales bacterium]|nr:enoyl-CoA hydratase-related protein [Dehalococcoidales bacterium]